MYVFMVYSVIFWYMYTLWNNQHNQANWYIHHLTVILYVCVLRTFQIYSLHFCLIFWGNSMMFSITSMPIYILTNTARRYTVVHYSPTSSPTFWLFLNTQSNRCKITNFLEHREQVENPKWQSLPSTQHVWSNWEGKKHIINSQWF